MGRPRWQFPKSWMRGAAAQVRVNKMEMRDGGTQMGLSTGAGRVGEPRWECGQWKWEMAGRRRGRPREKWGMDGFEGKSSTGKMGWAEWKLPDMLFVGWGNFNLWARLETSVMPLMVPHVLSAPTPLRGSIDLICRDS